MTDGAWCMVHGASYLVQRASCIVLSMFGLPRAGCDVQGQRAVPLHQGAAESRGWSNGDRSSIRGYTM